MHRVQLHYTLTRDASAALVRNPLIDLLQAVDAQGSISAAARALGLSYRHVWGELKRWENELGNELIVWEKGQSARLSEFGAKLMWAERQAQARLAPQIEALRADLERAFAVAFDPSAHVLTLYASHDDALPALRAHAAQQANLHLDIRFTGSVDAIRRAQRGPLHAGGLSHPGPARARLHDRAHLPAAAAARPAQDHRLRAAHPGPDGGAGQPAAACTRWRDVARQRARFVNRALGTGTRVLLDDLLAQRRAGRAATSRATRCTEPSHAAVAQAIAAGAADTGLGIEAGRPLARPGFRAAGARRTTTWSA